ncbi:hypothetical protein AACH28_04880 [Sphingobacterium thalpophilum]|uniref:Uncharacterized protein n=1 Tax=Sphingobacterium thalpophilum TaxID=259 RepID=A0ACD5C529_9SPHI|nr:MULTISPECIES: hypothetical protein [unclassified Sphingobacterium]APU97276.1 hypothetical protein BV902_13735 [Sphingobacterium sp. B29]
MNRLFTTAALLCALSLGFTSCSKDEAVVEEPTEQPEEKPEDPKLSDETAVSSTATIAVPSGVKTFYDFKTNTVQEETKSMINLSGMYGSTLQNTSSDNYKMGYFDQANTSIEKLTLTSVLAANITLTDKLGIDASSAGAPVTGPTWIIYDFANNHAVYPTANRYIVMYKGEKLNNEADELYVIQAGGITAANGNATYNINFKKFVKQ